MRKCLAFAILMGALFSSLSARAQTPIKLSSLQVQLWPEYDQPSMLVIYDLRLPDDTKLPISITLQLPKDANLVAVASQAADGSLLNADYQGPTMGDSRQTISLQIPTAAIYHIEYYEPLSKTGDERHFSYRLGGRLRGGRSCHQRPHAARCNRRHARTPPWSPVWVPMALHT